MEFETAFEREKEGFFFTVRPGDEVTRARAGGSGVVTIWRPEHGEGNAWWSGRPAVHNLSVRDATGVYNFFTGGVSARVPSFLFGHPGTLPTRQFKVLGHEAIDGVPCVQVGAITPPLIKFWIGKADSSLRRAWGTWRVTGERPYDLEVTVDYSPTFDAKLSSARFQFVPPVVEPLRDACLDRGVASDGSDPLIDALEDGDFAIRKADQRFGRWWRYGDDDCDVSGQDFGEAPPGDNPSHYAAHVSAKNCGSWGFGLGLGLNGVSGHCGYDAGTYDGVSFLARTGTTNEKVTFIVRTRQTVPLDFGGDGSCEAAEKHCWDGFATNLDITPEWHTYTFKWSDLGQAGFGNPTTFDVKQVVALQWQLPTRADGSTTELWLDQVSFFKGERP
jgi:hypothetical protein